MIQIGIGVCPRGLADRGPNERFFDVGGGFIVAGQETDGGGVFDGAAEELAEEVEDVGGRFELGGIRGWSFSKVTLLNFYDAEEVDGFFKTDPRA